MGFAPSRPARPSATILAAGRSPRAIVAAWSGQRARLFVAVALGATVDVDVDVAVDAGSEVDVEAVVRVPGFSSSS